MSESHEAAGRESSETDVPSAAGASAGPVSEGLDLSALAAGARSSRQRRMLLSLQRSAGNAAVGRLLAAVAPPRLARQAATPGAGTASRLLVEDGTEPRSGQMCLSAFLDAVRSAARETAEQALAGSFFRVAECPWIDHWIDHYRRRRPDDVEAAMLRYAPATGGATTAADCIPLICERIRQGIAGWRESGEIPDAPAGGAAQPPRAADPPRAAVLARTPEPGAPLEPGVRARMGAAFGADFSAVRVHEDARLAQGARAVTMGHHIAFASGEYEPGTALGDGLIAHELAHVVQQGAIAAPAAGAPSGRSLEADANLAALAAVAGAPARPARRTGGLTLQSCAPPGAFPQNVLEGEEAERAIELYQLRIEASRHPERGPTGMVAQYHVMSREMAMAGPVWGFIASRWYVFRPGEHEARSIRPSDNPNFLDVEFDEAGDWLVRAEVNLGEEGVVYLDLIQHIDPLQMLAEEAFAQTQRADYVRYRAAFELRAVLAGGGALRDQNPGRGDYITLEGSGRNPIRATAPYGRQTYAIHRSASATGAEPASHRWYAVPEGDQRIPDGYGGHRITRYHGRNAFELGSGTTAGFHIERAGSYTIVCEELDRDENIVQTVRYLQVVQTAAQAREAAHVRETAAEQAALLAENIVSGQEIGLRAVHTSASTGNSTELALFLGRAPEGHGYSVVDLTPGVTRSVYSGGAYNLAIDDFESWNTYPQGLIILEGPDVPRREIPTTGTSDAREVSSGLGWASLGLGVVGFVSLFTPAAVAAPYLFAASAVAGGSSGALSLADELRNNEPDAIKVAIDVVGIAGSLIGLAQAGQAITAGRQAVTLAGGVRYLVFAGVGTDVVSGMLLSVDSAREIERILGDDGISRDQKVDQIVRILAMLALTGGMVAYGARDLRGAQTRLGGALGEDLTTRLSPDVLHNLDALGDDALGALQGLGHEQLENVSRVVGTNRSGAVVLSGRYGAEFVEAAGSGRFTTLEDLAEELGARAGRERLPDDPGLAGSRPGTGEPGEVVAPRRTEQGDIDVTGRPDDAIALDYEMSAPNAHGEPHAFHMTENGWIFRCSDVCQELVANIEARTRRVRERAAQLQRSLDPERNWREEGWEITASAKRLRENATKKAAAHAKRVRNIARARSDDRRAALEEARREWLEEARESFMRRAEQLEQRISALEEAVGIQRAPDAPPRPPATLPELRERFPDLLDADPELTRELREIEQAGADPEQAVDVRRRIADLEQRLMVAAEDAIPATIARARELQVAAGNGLVQVRAAGRLTDKCRACAGDIQTVSGGHTVAGYEQRTREVIAYGARIGHTFADDNFDAQVAGVLNAGPGPNVAVAGSARASHAEKQAALAAPGEPIGVSLPMCFDCYEFFRRHAIALGRPQVVADPDMVRVFYPDGTVRSPSRSGTRPFGGSQP